jgi:hypothetical protein
MPSVPPEAGHIRLATWNIEWFNALFDDRDRPLRDEQLSARYKVTRGTQLAAIARVMAAMNADGLMVIEAPNTNGRRSTVRALERFAREAGLRTTRALVGFPSETEQEIAFLWNPARLAARHDPRETEGAPRFDRSFRYDLDTDAAPETIRFSKPPLEVALAVPGRDLRLIGVHAKSKAPHGARSPDQAMRLGIENRRKQLAQCLWLRERVAVHLATGESLVVMGDFNDGPGLDEYERLFGQSGVEIVLGTTAEPRLRLHDPNAALTLGSRMGVSASTARFYLKPPGRYFEALLDFIMVSPDLFARAPVWRIWHPFNDPELADDPVMRESLLAASDHFPVTIDLPI